MGRQPLTNFGTSPHTRGKHADDPRQVDAMRNIPAYAGKTHPCDHKHSRSTEHPRIRGENAHHRVYHSPYVGTSPHTRGKPYSPIEWGMQNRNIPAYAGKTYACPGQGRHGWEHPRIRGENPFTSIIIPYLSGTSPHTRGKLPKHRSFCR